MILPETKIILYKGKTLKDGTHPIMLQVKVGTNDYRRIGLKMSSHLSEWNTTDSRYSNSTKYEKENRDLFDHETRANDLMKQMIDEMKSKRKEFDFHKFKALFLGKKYETTDKPDTLMGFFIFE